MENPGFPPLIDILERAGAEIVAVDLDDEGIIPGSLADALALEPVAVFVQPRAQNPTGISMSVGRCRQLADVLAGCQAVIVEDDHSGDIATGEDVSLGQLLPDRTVHIRSYSKSHGPDLRIAAVGGSADVIDPLVSRRMLGPGWTSRLLQAVLVELLTDPAAIAAVTRARSTYAMRSLAVRAGLAGEGVVSTMGDGINAWVEVGRRAVGADHPGRARGPGVAWIAVHGRRRAEQPRAGDDGRPRRARQRPAPARDLRARGRGQGRSHPARSVTIRRDVTVSQRFPSLRLRFDSHFLL